MLLELVLLVVSQVPPAMPVVTPEMMRALEPVAVVSDSPPRVQAVLVTASWCKPCKKYVGNDLEALYAHNAGWRRYVRIIDGEGNDPLLKHVRRANGDLDVPSMVILKDGKEKAIFKGCVPTWQNLSNMLSNLEKGNPI